LKLHLYHFSKIKIQKESQNSRNQGFFLPFCMMIEGSGSGSRAGSGSGSIPLTSGSGSGSWRPKNMWIRWIRIRIRPGGKLFCEKSKKLKISWQTHFKFICRASTRAPHPCPRMCSSISFSWICPSREEAVNCRLYNIGYCNEAFNISQQSCCLL
jgi:hypothetical protein